MRSILTVAVAVSLVALACTESTPRTLPSDAADCDCRIDGAELVMSWSCYCAAYGDRCTRTLAAQCNDFRQRFEYPACGLTVLRVVPALGPLEEVYDASGTLVGARISSDTSPFACPSDPSMTALVARAGQLPAATCAEVACGVCASSPTSCAAADGSAGQ